MVRNISVPIQGVYMRLSSLKMDVPAKSDKTLENRVHEKGSKEAPKKRSHPSKSEILEKLKKHREEKAEKSPAYKVDVSGQREIRKLHEGEEYPSDVGFNDPADPATRGKLKSLLQKGAFHFSDREKQVLSQILAED